MLRFSALRACAICLALLWTVPTAAQEIVWTRFEDVLVQTSADHDYVWGVNKSNEIFRRPISGGEWEKMPGLLVNVSATGAAIWGVNRGGEVFMCRKPCDSGAWERVPGRLSQVSGGPQYVWGIQQPGDKIFKRFVDGSGEWRQVPGGLKQVSTGATNMVWGVNGAGEIYRCAKPCDAGGLAWERVVGALSQVSANDREVWGVNGAGDIYHLPKPCPEGMEESNGLCYRSCQQDWAGGTYGDGPVCWQHCPVFSAGQAIGQTVPYDCGIGCARDINACASVLLDMVNAPINLALNIISFGTSGAATSGATAATGGAAAATSGVTKAALASTQRWNALMKALEQAQSIAETAANVQEVFGQVEALETELDRWVQDAGANFSDFTSHRIEQVIDQQFPNPEDRIYIKRKYALFHFNSLLEQDGWRLGKLISGYAGYEPSGIVALIDAFVQPMCKVGANPFPSVTTLPRHQRTPDRSISATLR